MHIVIDGYNLIRQSARFSAVERLDLQAGREALVDALSAYKKVKPFDITVVFDGSDAPLGMPRRDRMKGITIRYSQPGELADAVIKRMVGRERERLLVVSSDHEVAGYAASKGSAVLSAADFEERLTLARLMDVKGLETGEPSEGWQPTTRKKGPARKLPKRLRRMKTRTDKI